MSRVKFKLDYTNYLLGMILATQIEKGINKAIIIIIITIIFSKATQIKKDRL